ncbi:C, putative [Ricinus communis]|uniref:C, putative n=1 Tax=Ricinus communis TaxID=3988 RepID=B9SBB7_RICCO|nr:C, putative [Ricinus communis]
MASDSLKLVPLFLLTFFSCQLLIAKGCDALIQTLCSKTEEPVLCKDCFNRNPESKTADAKGLVLISIQCGEYDAELLHNYTFNLWENTPESKTELKQVLDTCSSQTLLGHDSFRGATVAVEEGVFDWRGYAIDQITREVAPFLNRCLEVFKEHPQLAVPQYILAGTVSVNQDIAIILGILKNI